MFKKVLTFSVMTFIIGCATNENQLRETFKKNPKIIFDIIEENPEQFIEVVNRAAQKAQQKQYEKQVSDTKSEQDKDIKNPKKPKLEGDRRLIGTADSPITIVEYADFQCPACRMAFESLNQFKDKYKGKIQFYYKHMPLDFHQMAYPAAQYFEAIKLQDKTKSMKFFDYVFQNQRQLTEVAFLKKAAVFAGANTTRLQEDIKSEKVRKVIEDDMAEFQNFGFTGTPVLLLNGVAVHGAQKLEELERLMALTTSKN